MSRSLQIVSILSRPATFSRPLIRKQHNFLRHRGPVTIQPVRFRRPPFSIKRTAVFAVRWLTALWIAEKVSDYILGIDSGNGEETQAKNQAVNTNKPAATEGKAAKKEEEAEENADDYLVELPDELPEDAIFIPLSWGKRRPPVYYKGTDPEWQNYVKFSHDKKKVNLVRQIMAKHVSDTVASTQVLSQFLGTPLNVRREWLDFEFPYGPPPEYDRIGLEIADDYVAITTRPQSDLQYRRLKSVLWPDSIAKSFWASAQIFWGLQYARAKSFLRSDSANESETQSPHTSVNLPEISNTPDQQQPAMKAGPASTKDAGTNSEDAGASSASQAGDATSLKIPKFQAPFSYLGGTGRDPPKVTKAFRKTLVRTWNPPTVVERGEVLVSGFLDIGGSKATVKLSVIATFNPQTNIFKLHSLYPFRTMPRILSPKG